MAIDQAVLDRQRLSVVKREEYQCPRCGRRTTDKQGVCARCHAVKIPNFRKMTSEEIGGLIAACRAELVRRRDELNAALEATR